MDFYFEIFKSASPGRIELTSERSDLESEIKGLEKTIEEETTMRDKEHEDFLAAKDEMDKAIAALKSAIEVRRPSQAADIGSSHSFTLII